MPKAASAWPHLSAKQVWDLPCSLQRRPSARPHTGQRGSRKEARVRAGLRQNRPCAELARVLQGVGVALGWHLSTGPWCGPVTPVLCSLGHITLALHLDFLLGKEKVLLALLMAIEGIR